MPATSTRDTAPEKIRWIAACLVIAVLAVHANSLRAPFVYDDTLAIPDNPSIRHLWRLDDVLWPQAQGGTTVSGRPVLNLSFALSYALSGEQVWGHHLVNMLVHAAAALVLFGIVRRTLAAGNPALTTRMDAGGSATAARPPVGALPLAAAIAALWALHPLQTQAVTYTVQRAESLMGFFYLLTLYAFVRAVDCHLLDDKRARAAGKWLALSVGACALGMGTKEVMATAPLVVLLYDRAFVAGTFAAAWRARRGYYLALVATWLVLAALVASTGGNRGGTVGLGVGVPWWAYGLTQFQAVTRYLALGVWPQPLVFEYGTFWVERTGDILPYLLVIVPLLGATAWALRHRPAAGFCAASFFLILAPTSLAPGTIQMIVEHRMYLPLAAVIGLGVVAVSRQIGGAALPAAGALAIAWGVTTVDRNRDYRSHLALWSDTVAKRPDNPRAHEGLAEAYAETGRLEDALRHRREAVRLLPDESHYHYNYALTLAQAGRFEDAVRSYRVALRLAPAEPRTHNNLAVALVQLGKVDQALAHYAEAIRLQPKEPQYRYNQAIAFLRLRRLQEAATGFAETVALQPAHADAHFNLGNAFSQLHRPEKAREHYAATVKLRPDDAEAQFRLANLLLDLDRAAEAIPHYEAAARLRPNDPEARHNLGVACARLERWQEARAAFDEALQLKPDYADALRHRQQLRDLTGF